MKTTKLILLVLLSPIILISQNPKIDRNKIYIGDRFAYIYSIEDKSSKNDILIDRIFSNDTIEIVSIKIDTVLLEGNKIIEIKYSLTSFIEGNHILIDRDSNKFAIEVLNFPIDTTKTQIKDIKANAKEPISFSEILPIIFLVLGIIGLIILGYYLYKYWKKNKKFKIRDIFTKQEIPLAPHIIALNSLETLRKKRLPEHGENKRYYTEISEILRNYLFGRFGLSAMEMTSDEIFNNIIRIYEINKEDIDNLEFILRKSDLVKFAKLVPEHFIDDKIMKESVFFVENTKKEEDLETNEDKKEKEVGDD